MAKDETAGQHVAKLLTLLGALVSGEPIEILSETSSVEVVRISRDNWPDAPIFVGYVTADRVKSRVIEDFEIA